MASTNAGGAVGFLPPVNAADVRPAVASMAKAIAAGSSHLIVAVDGVQLAGWLVLERGTMPMVRHWAWLKRLMVSSAMQRQGLGRSLTSAAVGLGRSLGLEQLYLTCRSETGLEDFYANLGWVAVGRMPRNLRLADGSYRDEIYMMFDLLVPGDRNPPQI